MSFRANRPPRRQSNALASEGSFRFGTSSPDTDVGSPSILSPLSKRSSSRSLAREGSFMSPTGSGVFSPDASGSRRRRESTAFSPTWEIESPSQFQQPSSISLPRKRSSVFQAKVNKQLFSTYVVPKASDPAYSHYGSSDEEGRVLELLKSTAADSTATELNLSNVTFSEDSIVLLSSVVSAHTNLRRLDLEGASFQSSFLPKVVDAVQKSPCLEEVVLRDTPSVPPVVASKVADILAMKRVARQRQAQERKNERKRKQSSQEALDLIRKQNLRERKTLDIACKSERAEIEQEQHAALRAIQRQEEKAMAKWKRKRDIERQRELHHTQRVSLEDNETTAREKVVARWWTRQRHSLCKEIEPMFRRLVVDMYLVELGALETWFATQTNGTSLSLGMSSDLLASNVLSDEED